MVLQTRIRPHPTPVVFLVALGILAGCSTPDAQAPRRYEFTQPQMGVPFRIVLYADTEREARTASQAAFTRIEQLNQILSDYDYDSELSRLSRTSGSGQAVEVSEDLWRVLWRGQEMARLSNGAFDVTAGPAVNLWRRARRRQTFPEERWLTTMRARVGYEFLRLDPRRRTAELLKPDMRLDLGGIAKGYALQEAQRVLQEHGISRALVAGGGDLVVGEAPPGRKGWRITVAPLDVPGAPPARLVSLEHRALATSGDVFQHVEIDGVRYSHIVDPRTGLGLTDRSLVTVIARDGMTADALATAVSVLGPEAGMALVERERGTAAHMVRQPREQIETQASRRFDRFLAPGSP